MGTTQAYNLWEGRVKTDKVDRAQEGQRRDNPSWKLGPCFLPAWRTGTETDSIMRLGWHIAFLFSVTMVAKPSAQSHRSL